MEQTLQQYVCGRNCLLKYQTQLFDTWHEALILQFWSNVFFFFHLPNWSQSCLLYFSMANVNKCSELEKVSARKWQNKNRHTNTNQNTHTDTHHRLCTMNISNFWPLYTDTSIRKDWLLVYISSLWLHACVLSF